MVNPNTQSYRPSAQMLELMVGSTTTQEIEGKKVNLVSSGGGLLGLKTLDENRGWGGWLNHWATTARVATFIATELKNEGVEIDPQLVLDGTIAVHLGRRQFQEANDYPNYVEDAGKKIAGGSDATAISVGILDRADMSYRLSELVLANSGQGEELPNVQTIEEKAVLVADLMVSQDVMPLKDRLKDLLNRGRIPANSPLPKFALAVQGEIFGHLNIKPEDFSNEFPPQPAWEQELRSAYIGDAREAIVRRIDYLASGQVSQLKIFDQEFPNGQWWSEAALELHRETTTLGGAREASFNTTERLIASYKSR